MPRTNTPLITGLTLRVESDSQMDGDVGVAAVLTLALEMFLDETARVWPCCCWCSCIVIVKRPKRCNSEAVLAMEGGCGYRRRG
jgi:hypothetical protein